VIKHARKMPRDQVVIINMSGRGDKDVQQVAQFFAARGGEGSVTAELPRTGDQTVLDTIPNSCRD
jgi:hypothetical protein